MATSNIKVLSYNVQMRPLLDRPHHTIRAGKIPAEIKKKHYDVIVFQEAFSDPERNKLIYGLKTAFPYCTQVIGGGDSATRQDGGVVILSKYRILRYEERIFGDHSGADSRAKKGVAYAQIQKDGIKYHIFGTHAQAGTGYQKVRIRNKQFATIRAMINYYPIPPEEPVIIAGDMNVNYLHRSKDYQDMLRTLDATFPGRKLGHPYTSDPVHNVFHDNYPTGNRQYLDYVFYSNSHLKPRNSSLATEIFRTARAWGSKDGRIQHDLSDHYAVTGNFTFNIPARNDSNKFLGRWQRIKVFNNNEPNGPKIQFNVGRTFNAENPSGPPLDGFLYQITLGRPFSGKIKVWVDALQEFQEYNYIFRKNPALDRYFQPGNRPWEKVLPPFNELVLKSPGLEQTYAFIKHLKDGPGIPDRP